MVHIYKAIQYGYASQSHLILTYAKGGLVSWMVSEYIHYQNI